MEDPARARQGYRDAGLAMVRRWTRRSIAAGVILSGVLAAGLAHLLPGQTADAARNVPIPLQSTEGSAAPAPDTSRSEPAARTRQRHRHRRPAPLTPPKTPPAPLPAPLPTEPHAISGGS